MTKVLLVPSVPVIVRSVEHCDDARSQPDVAEAVQKARVANLKVHKEKGHPPARLAHDPRIYDVRGLGPRRTGCSDEKYNFTARSS